MIRRIARELVLQSLFQIDFSEGEGANALNAAIEERADKSAEKSQSLRSGCFKRRFGKQRGYRR